MRAPARQPFGFCATLPCDGPEMTKSTKHWADYSSDRVRLQEAKEKLRSLVARAGETSNRLLLLAFADAASGSIETAADLARRVLELSPSHVQARVLLARLELHGGNAENAGREIEAALQLDPWSSTANRVAAEVARARGRKDQWVDHLRRAAALDPFDPETKTLLGLALNATGHLVKAHQTWADVIDRFPDYEPAHRAAVGWRDPWSLRTGLAVVLGVTALPGLIFAIVSVALVLRGVDDTVALGAAFAASALAAGAVLLGTILWRRREVPRELRIPIDRMLSARRPQMRPALRLAWILTLALPWYMIVAGS